MNGKLGREDVMRELELLPVWRERKPHTDESIAAEKISLAVSGAALNPETAPATIAQSMPEDGLATEPLNEHSVRKSSVNKASERKAVSTQEPDRLVDEIPPADPTVVNVPVQAEDIDLPSAALSPVGESRLEIINRMDWPALQQAVEHCPACNLCKTRIKTVFGIGDQNADWLFVGEAPGAEEDRKGEPFVGQAGKLLDNMLAAIQLKRGDNVYIANVLKCRPPDNRDPHGEEVMQCDPYLKRQVELIKPKLIVALGKFAAQSLLDSKNTIAAMRGTLHDYHGVPVIVTYHPAYLLRSPSDKAKAWEDLCYARNTMQGLQDS